MASGGVVDMAKACIGNIFFRAKCCKVGMAALLYLFASHEIVAGAGAAPENHR